MKVIYKYELTPEMHLPIGAVILDVQWQHDHLVLWALVDTDAPREPRRFAVIGTGAPMPDNATLQYCATVQTPTGLVWHVFEQVVW